MKGAAPAAPFFLWSLRECLGHRLKDQLVAGLRKMKPDLVVNTPIETSGEHGQRHFQKVDNAVLLAALDYHGVSVSAGSACHTQSNAPSHVLKAIGLSDEEARQTLRLSLSDETTSREIRYALRGFAAYFAERLPAIGIVTPARLTEEVLFSPGTYVLDVRLPSDRKVIRSLPGAHEVSFATFSRDVSGIPRNRHVLVVCRVGVASPVVAYFLRARGFRHVSFLLTGMVGWRMRQPSLYEKYATTTVGGRGDPGRRGR